MISVKILEIDYTDLIGISNYTTAINGLFPIPANCLPYTCVVKTTQAFVLSGAAFIQLYIGDISNTFRFIPNTAPDLTISGSTVNALGQDLPSDSSDTTVIATVNADSTTLLANLTAGHCEIWMEMQPLQPKKITASGNISLSMPGASYWMGSFINPTNNETIRIGTTSGGQEIMVDTAFVVGANDSNFLVFNKYFTANTTVYIQGATHSFDITNIITS